MTGIFNLRLPNQSYFCVGCRHFIKKSRKARKKQPTLSKTSTLKLPLLPLLGCHRFSSIKSFSGMNLNISVTFTPGTKLKHSRKCRPLDEFEFKA